MGSEKFSDSAKSGYNKGTIRTDIWYLVISKDVRRHRLISISYISHGRCHGRGREFESRRPRHSFRQCLRGFSSHPAIENDSRKKGLKRLCVSFCASFRTVWDGSFYRGNSAATFYFCRRVGWVFIAGNVVAAEHGSRFVAGNLHCYRFSHAASDHFADSRPSEVVPARRRVRGSV
jgi:hypothetical protein